jgi:hypothetical protein
MGKRGNLSGYETSRVTDFAIVRELLFYSAIALVVLFTLGQFAAHLPQRYRRGNNGLN